MGRYARSVALSVVVALGCASGGTDPDPGSGPGFSEADVTILFVGNSLTSTPDVPRLVRSLAERQGLSVATLTVAHPDFSLEDHWNNGIANRIRSLQPDILVMQQGPSSLPASRDHLVYWSGQLAEVVREVGGEPALYMVWPDATRRGAFSAVESSYAAAAAAVEGRLLPAGTTWLRAWEQDEALPLYGDGLHASYLGALAAAQTIYAALFDVDPADIPALDDGVPAARVDLLRSAVGASLEQWHH
jgi:hypothetical protein